MKLILPHTGELDGADLRLARLMEFLGATWEPLPLPKGVTNHEAYLETAIPNRSACIILNPCTLQEWLGSDRFPAGLASFFLSRSPRLIVHGLRPDPFDSQVVAALSRGRLNFVRTAGEGGSPYEIGRNFPEICGAFSGLSFGPSNPANDRVLTLVSGGAQVRTLISIEGQPLLSSVQDEGSEVVFIGSEGAADLEEPVGEAPLGEYFSRLLPLAMVLRYAAGDECWRAGKPHASLVIDDPLLRKSYGFLNFESLLGLAERHDFHASIAFIPHNFRRSSPQVTRMFQQNAARLSICFHGNDHTGSEMASHSPALLNGLLSIAEGRMAAHEKTTGIACDRVMVFPQGSFSEESMKVLQAHNFLAAVNTNQHPEGESVRLTIQDLAQPAVLRYGHFPLFIRKPIRKIQKQDIAFNIFFGRPVLVGEHHDVFQRPDSLAEMAARIHSVAPGVKWTNLAEVVSNSTLTRHTPDGACQVRAYSGAVRISNGSRASRKYFVEWRNSCDGALVERAIVDGTPGLEFEADRDGVHLSAELNPGAERVFAVVHRNLYPWVQNLGMKRNAQAFVRRRLSEFRDNYLSKNENVLKAAKAFQRRMLKI